MEPLAVVRRMSARPRSPRPARAWVKLDGRWRRCRARSLGLERDVVTSAGSDGWLRHTPGLALRVTLSGRLADGTTVALVAYPARVTRTALGYRLEALEGAGGWQRLEPAA